MNLPNKLTVSRMILVFVFAIFAFPLSLFPGCGWVALAIYVIASVTDALDGHLARKNHQVTDFGKFLDPLADKLLVNMMLIIIKVTSLINKEKLSIKLEVLVVKL